MGDGSALFFVLYVRRVARTFSLVERYHQLGGSTTPSQDFQPKTFFLLVRHATDKSIYVPYQSISLLFDKLYKQSRRYAREICSCATRRSFKTSLWKLQTGKIISHLRLQFTVLTNSKYKSLPFQFVTPLFFFRTQSLQVTNTKYKFTACSTTRNPPHHHTISSF